MKKFEQDVHAIVKKFLVDNDFDGLVKDPDSVDGCGCHLDCLFDNCKNIVDWTECVPAFLASDSYDGGNLWFHCKNRKAFLKEMAQIKAEEEKQESV